MTSTMLADPIQRLDSFVPFSELGKKVTPYASTHRFAGQFINDNHKFYSTCKTGYKDISVCIDIGIDGYLQRDDALKIYELAYFSSGDILELGTYCGLSTSIIAKALHDAQQNVAFETVDIDANTNIQARKNVLTVKGGDKVAFNVLDAAEYMDKAIVAGRKYGFIFIDHWHGYDTTYDAAIRAKKLLVPGAFVLFHDYNDPANADPEHVYGVYQAAHDVVLSDPNFDFYGTFGCTALFRKRP